MVLPFSPPGPPFPPPGMLPPGAMPSGGMPFPLSPMGLPPGALPPMMGPPLPPPGMGPLPAPPALMPAPPPGPIGPPAGPATAPPLGPPDQPPYLADPRAVVLLLAGIGDEDLPGYLASLAPPDLERVITVASQYPDLVRRIADALEPEPKTGPIYPHWFVEPPKPSLGDLKDLAGKLRSAWGETRKRMGEDHDLFFLRTVGKFKIDRDDPDFEEFVSTTLHDDAQLAINQCATLPVRFQLTVRDPEERDDTQHVEDALYAWRAESAARHAAAGNASIGYDESFSVVVRGSVVSRRICDLDDPEQPIAVDLLDPATCCPVWDRHGLVVMVRAYQDTLAGVVGDYDTASGNLAKNLAKPLTLGNPAPVATDPVQEVGVIEYWDRWWRAVWLDDGREIVPITAHKYGRVPYVYQRAAHGRPAAFRHPNPRQSGAIPGMTILPGGTAVPGAPTVPVADPDAREVGASFFRYRAAAHSQYEAINSKLMQIMRGADDPPWMVEQDDVARVANPDPEISTDPGVQNRGLLNHEQRTPLLFSPQAGVLQPLFQATERDRTTAGFPPSMYGVAGGVATGNAIEGMNESGRDKLTPVMETLQTYHAACAELDLILYRDWGHLAGSDGERGQIVVPYPRHRRNRPRDTPSFVLTPDAVRHSGTRVAVDLTQLRKQNLPAAVNVMNLGQQAGIPRRVFVELFGFSNDPNALMEEWIEEQTMLDPSMQPLWRALAWLQRGQRPDGSLDPFHQEVAGWILQQANPDKGGPPGPGGGGGPLGVNSSALNLAPSMFPQGNVGAGAGAPPLGPPPDLPMGLPPGLPPGLAGPTPTAILPPIG